MCSGASVLLLQRHTRVLMLAGRLIFGAQPHACTPFSCFGPIVRVLSLGMHHFLTWVYRPLRLHCKPLARDSCIPFPIAIPAAPAVAGYQQRGHHPALPFPFALPAPLRLRPSAGLLDFCCAGESILDVLCCTIMAGASVVSSLPLLNAFAPT